jgi:hypothetical protein
VEPYLHSPLHLHGVVLKHRDNFTFSFTVTLPSYTSCLFICDGKLRNRKVGGGGVHTDLESNGFRRKMRGRSSGKVNPVV